MISKSINLLIPALFHQSHDKHIEQFGDSGKTNRAMGLNMTLYGTYASGREFPVEASISQINIGGHKYFTVILRDITLRVNAEREQKQLNLELIRQNEQLQQFGYITSHNIRGPVATLLGLVGLYNQEQAQSAQNSFVISSIEKTVQKLDGVIRDLNQILELKSEINNIHEKVSLSEILRKC